MTAIGEPLPVEKNYIASPTCARFFNDDSYVRFLMGPFGSGKSVACVIEILRRACAQRKAPDGLRYTRFVVIRNSYRELADTTQKTFEAWIPHSIGVWSATSATFTMKFNDVRCEVMFRALDTPEDVKKLLSLEVTGAWINEAKEIPKAVFDALQSRIGRYPSMIQGGASWSGVWMDSNPCDSDHWLYVAFEEQTDEKQRALYKSFKQPSGLSEEAENITNLPGGRGYYERMTIGKTREWINVFVHGRYGFVKDGKPVFPEFLEEMHLSPVILQPIKGAQLVLGMDFGLTPAITVSQRTATGQWQTIEEFTSDSMGAVNFSREVATALKGPKYKSNSFTGFGDPAGAQRNQVDERTPFEVVNQAGLPIDPAPTNDFVRRREALAYLLTRHTMVGEPGFLLSPNCRVLRKALAGAYCFKRIAVGQGQERFRDVPDKTMYSHVAEAQMYSLLGMGEDHRALAGEALSVGEGDSMKKSYHRRVVGNNALPQRRPRMRGNEE